MEGPSIFLAAEQLRYFVGKKISHVSGNTTLEKERLLHKKILAIFSYGKYLNFQFDDFALRVHFLWFGSFQARVKTKNVTGDYIKKNQTPRLKLKAGSGYISLFSCSVKFVESKHLIEEYNYTIDTISSQWDPSQAYMSMQRFKNTQIADVLLDQAIFMGVGNIIKNEVLLLAKVKPTDLVKEISQKKQKEIIQLIRNYVFQFYEWRKKFELKKHYQIYRQRFCKICNTKVERKKTGIKNRISFICNTCQK